MTIWRNFIQTFHRFISGATTVTEGKDTLHFRPSPARTRAFGVSKLSLTCVIAGFYLLLHKWSKREGRILI